MFDFLKKDKTEASSNGPPQLWVGLGNPGRAYERHRHNVGFMLIDDIARDNHFPPFKKKFSAELAEGRIGGQKIILLKPQTFMNESGRAVAAAAKFYKIAPEHILVMHDELDIPFGKTKIKQGGGTGGHNGLKSIDRSLGDKNYWRLRLGIDHPGDKNHVSEYVLSNFSKEEQAKLDDWLYALTKAAPHLLHNNKNKFTNTINNY